MDELRSPVELLELDVHINDDAFVDAALAVFDRWVAEQRIPPGAARAPGSSSGEGAARAG